MFGVRFDCQSILNYFHLSLNNVTKGLGKYDVYLRFILKSIQKVIANRECLSIDLFEADFCDTSATKYDELHSVSFRMSVWFFCKEASFRKHGI